MSGENESSTDKPKSLKDLITEIESACDEYEQGLGLSIKNNNCEYLNLTQERIRSLTIEEAAEISVSLAFYGMFLQKELNRHSARANWCEANLKNILGYLAKNYQGYSYEERKSGVIKEDLLAQRLFALQNKAKFAVDRLSYLPSKVDFIAKSLHQLQESKRRYNG